MSRRFCVLFKLSLVTTSATGCSAPTTCNEDYLGEPLESQAVSGSVSFAAAGDAARSRLRVTLRNLPELWQPSSAFLFGNFLFTLRQGYANRAADGLVEMPRVSVAFADANGLAISGPIETSLYPPAEGSVFSIGAFGLCASEMRSDCCEYGARECTVERSIALERLDGAPYPPMQVSWEVRVHSSISSCPLNDNVPELVVEELEP